MKKNVLVFGAITSLIFVVWMIIMAVYCFNNVDHEGNMWLGYGAMIVAFSLVFVGVKNYRDKYNNGLVSFGKGFQVGLYIALIASTAYVLSWLVVFYCFMPDFMDKYVLHELAQAKSHGATAAELSAKKAEMAWYVESYKNPLMVIVLTYMEILPVGLVVALISALILKRKVGKEEIASIV